MSAGELVNCINSVRSDLKGIGLGSLKVGTADSWNLWVSGANNVVIQACDILLANAFSVYPSQVQN
jgi:exo-beta-1,3-glucanase (GH17 family)